MKRTTEKNALIDLRDHNKRVKNKASYFNNEQDREEYLTKNKCSVVYGPDDDLVIMPTEEAAKMGLSIQIWG